jgi:phospholipid-binding lipoprotein MlaA
MVKTVLRFMLTIVAVLLITGMFPVRKPVMAYEKGGIESISGMVTQNLPETRKIHGDDDLLDILEQDYEDEERIHAHDPLYYWNFSMFHFNDQFYFCLLKPVSQVYQFFVPPMIRQGVKNFFYNLGAPIRIVNSALQGRVDKTAGEISRFMLNSTFGILGVANPAGEIASLNPSAEDLGQTLGRYGLENGFYVVWPILGASTLRDSLGTAGDAFLDPLRYVKSADTAFGMRVLETVNTTSLHLGEYEDFKKAAVAPYESLRDAYLQRRSKQLQE